MRSSESETYFRYRNVYRTMAGIAALIISGALIWMATKLLPLAFWPNQSSNFILWTCGVLFFYFAAFGLVIIIILNSAQDFVLSEGGLRLQVFRYWWRDLQWDDVLELKDHWLYPGFTILILKQLTPFHRLLGLVYGFTFQPAFFIHISLGVDDYKKALDMIRKYAINLR
jgi:hypothetical protein